MKAYLPYSASVALPCPMGLRPGAGGCGSAALIASDKDIDAITSDHGVIVIALVVLVL